MNISCCISILAAKQSIRGKSPVNPSSSSNLRAKKFFTKKSTNETRESHISKSQIQ